MAKLDILPGKLVVTTRDQFRDQYTRSVQIRNPNASVKEGTQPWLDGSAIADVANVLSANALTLSRSIPLSEVSDDRLDQRLAEAGLPPRFPETGSQGSVIVSTSSFGATIPSGTELIDANNGLKFKGTATELYLDQATVPVAAIDTGSQTNLAPGSVLVFSVGIAGLYQSCIVSSQTDGTGLSGGRGSETDDEVRQRISDSLANPAAAGNVSEYIRLVENSLGHGVSVQKCFAYPALLGPGTIGVAFTMKPTSRFDSRSPSPVQMAIVRDYVIGQLPADDSFIQISILPQPTDISIDVKWATGADGWVDAIPWPGRRDVGFGAITVMSSTSATSFTLGTDDGVYSGVIPPSIGQSIAFFDLLGGAIFRQKKFLSVTGSGPWLCTCDTTNASSDTTYRPSTGQLVCPWSKSLDMVAVPILDHMATIGPGEMYFTFFDPGVRQRRQPVSPKYWPNAITSRIENGLNSLPSISDFRITTGLGRTTAIGTPGANVYLINPRNIYAFPL